MIPNEIRRFLGSLGNNESPVVQKGRARRVAGPGFGRRLRELRQAHSWTQSRLSQAAGIANTTLCNYERGVGRPSVDAIARLATALGCSPLYLSGKLPRPKESKRCPAKTAN